MKKTLAITALSLVTVGAFAQGQLTVNNNVSGEIVAHIHAPQSDNSAVTGNAANDVPAGSVVYTGLALGGTNNNTAFNGYTGNGSNFTAQIWAVAGQNQPDSALVAITQYNTIFRTRGVAAASGFIIAPSPASDPGIAGTHAQGDAATVELRVWDNVGGTVTSWANATTRGSSTPFNVTGLFSGVGVPGTAPNIDGLTAFSLVNAPEPSTIALGVMGAAAFLLRRRNK